MKAKKFAGIMTALNRENKVQVHSNGMYVKIKQGTFWVQKYPQRLDDYPGKMVSGRSWKWADKRMFKTPLEIFEKEVLWLNNIIIDDPENLTISNNGVVTAQQYVAAIIAGKSTLPYQAIR